MPSDADRREIESRKEALAAIRDGLACFEDVPAAALDAAKHETLRDVVDHARSLERQLTHEIDQREEGGEQS